MSRGFVTVRPVKSDTARGVLAANLRLLIERASKQGVRPSVRSWATGKGLDVRLVRLLKGQHAVTLDNLEKIAEACGLQPWQLLVEDMGGPAAQPPQITDADRELLKRLRHLLDQVK